MNPFLTSHVCTVCGRLLTLADYGLVCNQCRRLADMTEINQFIENERTYRLRYSRTAADNQEHAS